MKNLKRILFLGFVLISFTTTISAQDAYSVQSHEVVISGTSNIHDWTAQVMNLTGSAKIAEGLLTEVNINVNAKTLKSSKGSIMDSKMQDALNTEKFPKISYKLISNKIVSENNGITKISSTGNLTISGESKTIATTSICKTLPNENIEVSGSFDVLMTNYGIEPPTALFGTLKTANKVTVNFRITFQKLKG